MSEESKLVLPTPVPMQKYREPQSNIPATKKERDDLLSAIRNYIETAKLVPPIPLGELKTIAEAFLDAQGFSPKYLEYTAVLLNNELWRPTVATIPYNRRLLLLPKCLRVEATCPAPFDEFGLLCKKCGACSIQDLQTVAEKLGYAVLVAEGSPIVMAIIETGKIDAIVGVSCLSVLERAFPYMEAGAVPGVAIPLLQDDCIDTTVDEDWVWDIIHLTSEDRTHRMDLSGLRDHVDTWFAPEELERLMGESKSETESIGREWLSRAGKRWRPFLSVAVRQALVEDPEGEIPDSMRKVAIAVECFHKASLIHDDIEDDDETRYGEKTLHAEHGVPVALNVGDYLLGEGYRLLAESGAAPDVCAKMLGAAARGHRTLTLGQGAELCWARAPKALSSLDVLEIFREKTAPAFEVALEIGAIFAGADEGVFEVIKKYSDALGIAYQIRDDLHDLTETGETNDPSDLKAVRPTLPLALAHERAKRGSEDKELLAALWKREVPENFDSGAVSALLDTMTELGVQRRAEELLESYKGEAIRSLWDVENATLKGLLRRVIGKIFNDTEIKGWCNEFEARNAAGSEAGATPAA
ncbi:MAG: polyprenyl synthetase family protein [Planctomycetota bacterium]